ncbi:HEPN domain-containing protein [Salinibacter ruber]|uniref:HEPN domain-containing protein n=1 Tax=Salinibacter ruber TaxID=146919 RepID=UPI003C6DD3A8
MTEENNDQIRALQEKSEQALSDAELLLENSSVEATVNRGYYAVFQIARAALLDKEAPKRKARTLTPGSFVDLCAISSGPDRCGRWAVELGAQPALRSRRRSAWHRSTPGRQRAKPLTERP